MVTALAHAEAPTRICDLGGWTDTWFAEHGAVCHLPVWPGVHATVEAHDGRPGVLVEAQAVGRTWHWQRGMRPPDCPDPLVAATLEDASTNADASLMLRITSVIPPGASMGTSAATCVAVLSALDHWAGIERSAVDQARRAHAVETTGLGWQSGVQDQWASATGEVQLLTMTRYPEVTCRALHVSPDVLARLDASLLTVWLGRGHSSSAVHQQVIAALSASGPDDHRLEALRRLAHDGATALEGGDLTTYGRCLSENTALQQALHPALIGRHAAVVVATASEAGALGWKVNGAGGDGGTVTVLCLDAAHRAYLAGRIVHTVADTRMLPVRLAGGAPSVSRQSARAAGSDRRVGSSATREA